MKARIPLWFWPLALGLALRLVGIGYGLPAVFNADEPHVVDVAVSFGAGTLNPHLFKYPTLWMYVLFAAYGIFFAVWSGFGLLHSVRQFGELFVGDPTAFYLIGRCLAAAFSLAALERLYRAGALLRGKRAGLWAAAFLSVSPAVIVAAHSAKPDCFMLFLASWAWWFAVRHVKAAGPGDLALCGFAAGLAASAQYTALPLGALAAAAWAARPCGVKRLCGALALWAGGFLLGSPFIVLDFPAFRDAVRDQASLQTFSAPAGLPHVLGNMAGFAGSKALGAALLAFGAVFLYRRREKREAILFLVPLAAYAAILSASGEGAWERYLFAAYPALALIAAEAIEWALEKSGRLAPAWAALVLTLAPGALAGASFDRELLLPDTRTLSSKWIMEHIAPGARILEDQEHESPRLPLCAEMARELARRTRELGHPRARYYELMLSGHPGGGYFVYRILRSARDLHTPPALAAFSAAGRATLDVRDGLAAAREAGIDFVVLSDPRTAAERSPELAPFFEDVLRGGGPIASFKPEPGRVVGPDIEVYGMPRR